MSLEINNLTKARIERKNLLKMYQTFFRSFHIRKDCEVSLAFVGTRRMRKLNKQYRKKDRATDVLSFSYSNDRNSSHGESGYGRSAQKTPYILGEIVICPAQAKLPIGILFAHGLAHLLGYTHETKQEERMMRKMEKKILHGHH